MQPRVCLLKPPVELALEVQRVSERPRGLEVRLEILLELLDRALCLRVALPAKMPVELQLPTERGINIRRAPAVSVQRALPVPDKRRWQASQRPQALSDAPEQIRCLLGEHQRTRTDPRIAKTGNNDGGLACLTMADRDLTLRLPQIELADLPRPIDGALERALRREQRPHLTQIVINNALAARIAQRLAQLTKPNPTSPVVRAQLLADLRLERVQLRRPLRTAKTRRSIRAQRHPDRV